MAQNFQMPFEDPQLEYGDNYPHTQARPMLRGAAAMGRALEVLWTGRKAHYHIMHYEGGRIADVK